MCLKTIVSPKNVHMTVQGHELCQRLFLDIYQFLFCFYVNFVFIADLWYTVFNPFTVFKRLRTISCLTYSVDNSLLLKTIMLNLGWLVFHVVLLLFYWRKQYHISFTSKTEIYEYFLKTLNQCKIYI